MVWVRLTFTRFFLADSIPLRMACGTSFALPGTVADDGRAGISYHHQGRERQVLAALDHFGHAVDRDHLVFQLVVNSHRAS